MRFLVPSAAPQQVRADGMPQTVAVESRLQHVELLEGDVGSGDLGERDDAVETDEGRWITREEQVVEDEDLRRVRVRGGCGIGMAGGDRRLQLPSPRRTQRRGPVERCPCVREIIGIPSCAILLAQAYQGAAHLARRPPRAMEVQQRE